MYDSEMMPNKLHGEQFQIDQSHSEDLIILEFMTQNNTQLCWKYEKQVKTKRTMKDRELELLKRLRIFRR